MSLLDRFRRPTIDEAATSARTGHTADLPGQLRAEQESNLLLSESIAELELALEDAGWQRLIGESTTEFSRDGLGRAAQVARVMAIANPLIRRGLAIRRSYIWGQGVSVLAADEQVNDVVQRFNDDPSNRASFTGQQAQEELERALGTDGNVFLACFTNRRTGRVQVRSLPFPEITDIVCNPDDADEPWFYKRVWSRATLDTGTGRTTTTARTSYYPALGYQPTRRVAAIDGDPVEWDTPVHHVSVNRLDGWRFGIGDAYAALPWARAYKDFLGDWATLVRALSRYAWRTTTKGSKAKAVRERIAQVPDPNPTTGHPMSAGGTAVMSPDTLLEAVPKTGATIDSESGKPLAAMVAAALDVPVTALLSDPGQTGARAVAETLELPTRLAMQQRQQLWTATFDAVYGYVIDQAVRAPGGVLRGSVSTDSYTGRQTVTLTGDASPTVEVSWPDLDEDPADVQVQAIAAADQTGKMPPLLVARLLMDALGVADVDEHLDELTDEQGAYVDPYANAGTAAADAALRGEDPPEPR